MSFPGVYAKVKRAMSIKIPALNEFGDTVIIEKEGLLAHCVQHEIDHLNGITF